VPARISRITDQDPDVLAYLAVHGLVPGATLRVVARAPFEGPVTVVLDEPPDEEAAERPARPDAPPLALAFRMAAAIRAEAIA
jgi:hypothetical protein